MHHKILTLLAGLALCLGASAHAQSYAIDWFTIDGGGGASSGGDYTLLGTIGQPDAGQMSGGTYTLEGGFWGGIIAVQEAGAPTLHIVPAGLNYILSWAPNSAGFVLQMTDGFSPANWINAPSGATNPIPLSNSVMTRFYRLHKQ